VTLDRYRKLLSQVGVGQPALPNDNFDTSEGPGKYRLNHETHDARKTELWRVAGASG
jgi:hypothetical protein